MPEELATLALAIGREAGAFLLEGWQQVRPVATKSTRHDLVTQMDGASERMIRERIAAARPQDAVLGEEEGDTGSTAHSGIRWIVDPLDGTVNYFYGIPSWAVSIAAEVAGQIMCGVVIAPGLGEEYLAVRDQGAWRLQGDDRHALHVSGVEDLSDAMLSTGYGYDAARRGRQGAISAQVLPQVRDIRRVGAAAVDLAWVARGRIDVHYECGLNYWDWAAGALLVEEAGGIARGFDGGPAATDMILAGPAGLVDDLETLLLRLDARECL